MRQCYLTGILRAYLHLVILSSWPSMTKGMILFIPRAFESTYIREEPRVGLAECFQPLLACEPGVSAASSRYKWM